MKKKLCMILSVVLICAPALSACSTESATPSPSAAVTPSESAAEPTATADPTATEAPVIDRAALEESAQTFMSLLLDGKYDDCFMMFDETFASQVTATMLKNEWESITGEAGAFQNVGTTNTTDNGDGYLLYDMTNDFTNEGLITRVVLDQATGLIAQVYFDFTAKSVQTDADDLPGGVSEQNVIVGKGTSVELNGKLTYPSVTDGEIPGIVLIHGSGRHNMDETVGVNDFFKQLAYGLAQRGVAVLRYDRRTYADKNIVISNIDEAVVDDAVLARNVFLDQDDVQISNIYIAGHNFGAMMTPRVADKGGYDGMVLLAGTPRGFMDVLYEQYVASVTQAGLTEGEEQSNLQYIEEEYEKSKDVLSLSEEELQTMMIYDMPAYYLKSIVEYPMSGYLETLEKPTLIIQGDKDIQASVEKDFNAFEAYAQNNANIEMKLYEGLNNLFMTSTLDTPSPEEYFTESTVDATVLDDIATWLKAR